MTDTPTTTKFELKNLPHGGTGQAKPQPKPDYVLRSNIYGVDKLAMASVRLITSAIIIGIGLLCLSWVVVTLIETFTQ